MTYEEAITYINTPAPPGRAPTLAPARALLHALGDPQDVLRFVHVAGTNGKGSVCALLESVLRAAGIHTGLYISPHLRRFNERIRIGGRCVSDATLTAAITEVRRAERRGTLPLTMFDRTTAAALYCFAQSGCDIVVLETGLGGRFDATNVIAVPECAVICAIGLDHTQLLGDTLEQIAAEKAGIIKPGRPVALYQPEEPDVLAVFSDTCRTRGAALHVADFSQIERLTDGADRQTFRYRGGAPLALPLPGDFQVRNAATALEALALLRAQGWDIPDAALTRGFASVRWPARFSRVARAPDFIVDGGHNPQCAAALAESLLRYYPNRRRVLLLGMLADKDADGFLSRIVPCADAVVCTAPESARALSASALGARIPDKPVFIRPSLPDAVETARAAAGADGVVCAAGSLYLAGELLEYFGLEGV